MGSRSFVLALAQSEPGPADQVEHDVDAAVEVIRRAGSEGAALVLFAEGFPGPVRAGSPYDARDQLSRAAARERTAVCWSRVEANVDGRFQMVAYVYGPDGRELLRYARSHPATGDVHPTLSGATLAPGPEIAPTFELDGARIGLLICSELWLPEIARVLAIRGAEVLLAPAGGGFGRVSSNWQVIARARAIENQAYVGLTQNLYCGEAGAALIAGPEGDVAASSAEGLIVGRLQLDRARWLRAHDDSMEVPKPFGSLPGLLRARRPRLYRELADEVPGAYDYEAAAR